MRAKRIIGFLAIFLLWSTGALAVTEELSGNVVSGYTASVTAPFGGTVGDVAVREGQWVNEGDALVSVRTTRVVAAMDGTVRGIYAEPGDSVDGTVLNISPVSKYTVSCTLADAYSSPAATFVTLGERVYLKCQKDGSHLAVGRITAVSGADYTVETTGGELYMEEKVYVFRAANYASVSRIGTGTVARTALAPVTGSGSIVRIHVRDGEEVERGQLLFETVEGSLSRYEAAGNDILATSSGVVASVAVKSGDKLQKGGTVVTLYPREGYQLAVVVPEDMITLLHVGDCLRFYLEWNEAEPAWYEGTVASLSYISAETAGDTTTFTAYLDFEADESVRLGMSAVVDLET